MSELFIRINLDREMAWLIDSGVKDYKILVSSHILEGLKKSFTNLILKVKRPYVIDPITHVFTDGHEEVREKKWFSILTGAYGVDLIASPDSPVLEPQLLLDSKIIDIRTPSTVSNFNYIPEFGFMSFSFDKPQYIILFVPEELLPQKYIVTVNGIIPNELAVDDNFMGEDVTMIRFVPNNPGMVMIAPA